MLWASAASSAADARDFNGRVTDQFTAQQGGQFAKAGAHHHAGLSA